MKAKTTGQVRATKAEGEVDAAGTENEILTKTDALTSRAAESVDDIALTPWVLRPASVQTARLSEAIGRRGNQDDSLVASLGAAAAEVVLDYAPDAPQYIIDQSMIRLAGYLYASASTGFGVRRSSSAGGLSVDYGSDHQHAFRRSGAAALLSKWRTWSSAKCTDDS